MRKSGALPVPPLYICVRIRSPGGLDDPFQKGGDRHFKSISHFDERLDAQILFSAFDLPHVPAMNLADIRKLLL